MRRLFIAIVALAAVASPVAAFSSGYAFRRAITVAGAVVPSTQVNFPMLVSGTYSYLATVANGGLISNTVTLNSQTVPTDLIFSSDAAGATLLNWEVASYTAASGAIQVWVRVPALSNGSVIYMFYGNAAITTYRGSATSVWDTNFQSVYHFSNGTTLSSADSTANGHNGTVQGTTVSAASGQIDGAMSLGGSGYIDTGSAQYAVNSSFTFSVWANTSNWTQNGTYVAQGLDGFGSGWNSALVEVGGCSRPQIETVFGTTVTGSTCNPFIAGTWHMITGTYTSGSGLTTLYQDGVSVGSASAVNSGRSSTVGVIVGNGTNGHFSGSIDEAEISNIARPAAWILTAYNNQSSPSTFYTISTATAMPVTGTATTTASVIM